MLNVKTTAQKIKLKELIFGILFLAPLIFLSINIFFSQQISPLFLGIINNDKQASIDYLKKIKLLPQFNKELEYYKQTFGKEIEDEVFKDEKKRKEKIGELERLLIKNDRARDVLYGLYLLYKADGNDNKAQNYLNKAKEVDPTIRN